MWSTLVASFLLSLQTTCATSFGSLLPIYASPNNAKYYTPIEIDHQVVYLNIETASSHTWVITPETICISGFNPVQCDSPPRVPYTGLSTPTNITTNFSYADGFFIEGTYHDVGISLDCNYNTSNTSMQILFANYSSAQSLNPASGVLGLSSSPHSFLSTLTTNLSLSPFYGLALIRSPCPNTGDSGYLSLGTRIPSTLPCINYTSTTSTTIPIFPPNLTSPYPTISAFLTLNTLSSPLLPFTISSGNALNYLNSPASVTAIAESFTPPAWFDNATGLYFVMCDATPPEMSVAINDVQFVMDARDMIVQMQKGCVSAWQNAIGTQGDADGEVGMPREGTVVSSLGQAWLKGVYVEVWEECVGVWGREY